MSSDSPTPRTDARWLEEWEIWRRNHKADVAHGMADFAEELERELTALRADRDDYKSIAAENLRLLDIARAELAAAEAELVRALADVERADSETIAAEDKLKRRCSCEFSAGGVLKLKSQCEFHKRLSEAAEAREAALREDVDWIARNVSGAEFRRIGIIYSGNCSHLNIRAARAGKEPDRD